MKNSECKVMRPRLQQFADGELRSEEGALIRSHLMDCLHCRAIVGEVYGVRRFFEANEEVIRVPSDFASRVAALAFAGGPVDRNERPILPMVQLLAAIAAGIVLVAGSFMIWKGDFRKHTGVEVQAGTLSNLDEDLERYRKENLRKVETKSHPNPNKDSKAKKQ